jgi:hypothetical protein
MINSSLILNSTRNCNVTTKERSTIANYLYSKIGKECDDIRRRIHGVRPQNFGLRAIETIVRVSEAIDNVCNIDRGANSSEVICISIGCNI